MALKGCNACLKYIVFIFNLLFWLAGIGIVSVALWLRLSLSDYVIVHDDLAHYNTGTYILMAAGIAMTVVGFFGCCGAYRESSCLLSLYFALLVVVFTIQISAGIWSFMNKETLHDSVTKSLEETIRKDYGRDSVRTEAIDLIQREFKCCGSRGSKDYIDSRLNSQKNVADIGIGALGFYKIPLSCCASENENVCKTALQVQLLADLSFNVHSDGCADKFRMKLEENLGYVAGIAIGIAVLEVILMVFSIVLCCALRREDRYKA